MTLPVDTLPRLGQGDVVGLDLECYDPRLQTHGPGWAYGEGRPIGFALAWGEGSGYWSLKPEDGVDPWPRIRWLSDLMQDPGLTWVCHHAMYDIGWCSALGLHPRGVVHDTLTACALLDEYRLNYSLDAVARTYLGRGKNEVALREFAKKNKLHPKKDLWRMPLEIVAPYATPDAELARELWTKHFCGMLSEQDLMPMYALEMRLQPVLLKMRARGVRVDVARAEQVRADLLKLEAGLAKELQEQAGQVVDVWAAQSVSKAFDAKGLTYERTPKTKAPSFRKHWLEAHPDPMAHQIAQIRRLNKLRTTFVEGYVLQHAVNGRCYPEFHPLPSEEGGAVSGRFSSSNPNLQNLPARDELAGPMVRGLFLPEENQQWCAADYSQQEPRLIVHFADLLDLPSAKPAVARYWDDPTTDFHQMMAELTKTPRKQAKNLFLGKCYGMGGAKLCRALGLPTEWIEVPDRRTGEPVKIEVAGPEGQVILTRFNELAPFVDGLIRLCQRRARTRGFIWTLLRRRCRFPQLGSGERMWVHKAVNRLIQGSAADQIKAALLALDGEGFTLLATVHDEIDLSVEDEAEARRAAVIMEEVVTLRVPVRVDVELGSSWGEALG